MQSETKNKIIYMIDHENELSDEEEKVYLCLLYMCKNNFDCAKILPRSFNGFTMSQFFGVGLWEVSDHVLLGDVMLFTAIKSLIKKGYVFENVSRETKTLYFPNNRLFFIR